MNIHSDCASKYLDYLDYCIRHHHHHHRSEQQQLILRVCFLSSDHLLYFTQLVRLTMKFWHWIYLLKSPPLLLLLLLLSSTSMKLRWSVICVRSTRRGSISLFFLFFLTIFLKSAYICDAAAISSPCTVYVHYSSHT